MPILTINPNSYATPDHGGTLAVTGISNTGHSSNYIHTSAHKSGGNGADSKSQQNTARWFDFQFPIISDLNQVMAITLKFDWSIQGSAHASVGDGDASSSAAFFIGYSINGGSSWITQVSKSVYIRADHYERGSYDDWINKSDSESIPLNPATPINQIQVRDRMETRAEASISGRGDCGANADITTAISNIRLDVEYTIHEMS